MARVGLLANGGFVLVILALWLPSCFPGSMLAALAIAASWLEEREFRVMRA